MEQGQDGLSLHEACYQGRIDVVARLLANGADPNEPAAASGREWISCAGSRPKPLNCVAIAWTMTDHHVAIAKLLIEQGAVVDDTVLDDHLVESMAGPADAALRAVLEAARCRCFARGPAVVVDTLPARGYEAVSSSRGATTGWRTTHRWGCPLGWCGWRR
jgi:hypothetical protein